jgi:hypothetical protein
MLDPVTRMSLSEDWAERAEAARLVARDQRDDNHVMALRLLRDRHHAAVTGAMVAALLAERREAAVPLILRALGQDLPDEDDARDLFDAGSEMLLEGLAAGERDGVDVRGSVVSVLLQADDPNELVGALEAIGWLAPTGAFPFSAAALEHVEELARGATDETVRGLAGKARTALAAQRQGAGLPDEG